MVLKIAMAIRQQRTVISESKETHEVIPMTAPAYSLEKLSRLRHREGDPNRATWSP